MRVRRGGAFLTGGVFVAVVAALVAAVDLRVRAPERRERVVVVVLPSLVVDSVLVARARGLRARERRGVVVDPSLDESGLVLPGALSAAAEPSPSLASRRKNLVTLLFTHAARAGKAGPPLSL